MPGVYAIVETGGKKYRVAPGQTIDVVRLPAEKDQQVELGRVLLVVGEDGEARLGTPVVSGARVIARVVSHGKGKKIRGLKFKNKTHYHKEFGHRQPYTRLSIEKIEA